MSEANEKVALVTGATGGIGRATAIALAQRGISVVATGRKRDAGAETVKRIEDAGGRAAFIGHDANLEEDWIAAISGAIAAFGRLDILVDRKSTRLNSSHTDISRMPSSA